MIVIIVVLIGISAAEIYSIGHLENATEFARLHNLVHLKRIEQYDVFEGTLTNMKRFSEYEIFTDFKKRQIKRYFRNGITDPLYPSQWHLNVVQYSDLHTGKGVIIAIVDDGIQHTHPDLKPNYMPGMSYDFNGHDNDPTPYRSDGHGTSAAGVALASKNYVCGRGIAPEAGLAGIRLIAEPVYDYEEAQALSYKRDKIRIYSSSWGPQGLWVFFMYFFILILFY